MLFLKNYGHVNKKVVAILRDRDSDTEVWKKDFAKEDEHDVGSTIQRMAGLFQGKEKPVPNKNPGKCRACVLHKTNSCEFSVG